MRKIVLSLLSVLCMLCFGTLFACGDGPATPPPEDPPGPQLTEITGVNFSEKNVTYNGSSWTIEIDGVLPNGVSVQYSPANSYTNAGSYSVTATLSGEGYKTKILTATLNIAKATYDMSNAKWDYVSAFTYDGSSKTVSVSNLPNGVSVKSYADNSKINAGSYTASVSFNYDSQNYNAPTMQNCSWTINKRDFEGLTLSNDSVPYDTEFHSLSVVGNVPANSTITYTYNGQPVNQVSEIGSYQVVAVITNPNYNTKTLTATLDITFTEEQLYSGFAGNSIYFQNDLDDEKLYSFNSSTGTLKKVNNDKAQNIIGDGNNLIYSTTYIKRLIPNYFASIVAFAKPSCMQLVGNYLYYSVTLVGSVGIYKLDLSDNESSPVRISTDKTSSFVVVGNYIYYSNDALLNGKLYKVSISASSAEGTLVWDEKVDYLITDGADVYFNSKTLTGSAIRKYVVSTNTCIKLTTDSGKYLTLVGDYIYYINNDKLTSAIFGDGIYKVATNKSSDSSLPGLKLLDAGNDAFSSLTSDGYNLYYYKRNDLHFYQNNLSCTDETDLMENFVPPVDPLPTSGVYASMATHNGEIYYTDPLNESYIYKYNPTTNQRFLVVDSPCSGIWFNGNYLYFNSYMSVNYALYRMDLTNSQITKLNANRCDNLIFDGDYVYFIKVGSVWNNRIARINLAGTVNEKGLYEEEVLFEDDSLWVADFVKIGNTIYYSRNPKIYAKRLCSFTIGETDSTILNSNLKAETFTIANNYIFVYDTEGNISQLNMDGTLVKTIASNVAVTDMIVNGNTLFFSSESSSNTGIFAYNLTSGSLTKLSTSCGHAFTVLDSSIYFIALSQTYVSDYPSLSNGDYHMYKISGTSITKVI